MAVIREVCASFEAEMIRLGEVTSFTPPFVSAGAAAFFGSLNRWLFPPGTDEDDQTIVLPDPSLNLSLPYPQDELAFAATASKAMRSSAESVGAQFLNSCGLNKSMLNRPVTSLSGGERMLVSLIKASFLASKGRKLTVCSPFYWLDSDHRVLVGELLNTQDRDGVRTRLITLDGEVESGTDAPMPNPASIDLEWTLRFTRARIIFPACKFPRETEEKRIEFVLSDGNLRLRSPTLISGKNGIGKSTFAKVLAGLAKCEEHTPDVVVHGFSGGGKSRLLMQDTIIQLFGDSPNGHLERVFRYDKNTRDKARALFNALQSNCASALSSIDASNTIGDKTDPNSVLQAKIALAAERLVSDPPLLILDEPGWCLSKTAAQVFVQEIVKCAHERKTAVALISHQANWWRDIAKNELLLHATAKPNEVELIRK